MDTERTSVPAVRPALAAACPALAEGTPADAVAGVIPSFVASPSSTAEVAALLRAAAEAGLAVVPRGAGTGLSWGAPPSRCDLVVDLRSLDQVLEHAAGDLVARVQAGATIGQLSVTLGSAGQQLALDVPAEATVGGVVATGTAGPRRFRYGAPRDLLIGITVVRADGVVAHSGGKVVKNVAGYDLGKLFAGSQGTLGVITEVTFRLHPLPAAVAWVTAEFGPAERAGAVAAAAAAAGSPLVPSAVELDWPGGSQRPLRVGVLLEGTGPGVAERAKQMSELLAAPGGTVPGGPVQGGPVPASSVSVAETAPARWGALPDSAIVVRVSFWVSALGPVLDAVAGAGADAGVRPAVSGPAGSGALYACLDQGTPDADAVRFVTALRERAAGALESAGPRGGVTVLAASPTVFAAGADGAVPGQALMRAVRDQFDPDHRMFPGRGASPGGTPPQTPPRHRGGD
jgi:glycolate oxidase FAD binding subunit